MKLFDGYKKKNLTDVNVLLAGGGDKALSDFIGTLNWDSTNRKLQYKSASATTWTDLVTFGSNALNSTAYLPLTGGTISGSLAINRYLTFSAYPNYGTGSCNIYYNLTNDWVRFETGNINLKGNLVWHAGNFNPNNYVTAVAVTDDTTNHPNLLRYVKNGTSNYFTVPFATNTTNVYIEGASGDVNYPLLFTTATANGNGRIYADTQWRTAGITFNPSSNTLNVGSRIISSYANHTQTSMRHIDAGLNSVNTDHNLYIGYGAQTYTRNTYFYYSTGDDGTDPITSRTHYATINSNGMYAHPRFGVNGQNTGYNFYVNGTSLFHNVVRIQYSTPSLYIRNTVDTSYSIIKLGTNSNENASYIFQNGPDRTEDGGANVMTIRNNVGVLRLQNRIHIDSTGRVCPEGSNSRRAGMYGVYNSCKLGHIWSIGTGYMISDDGADPASLYGLAYFHTNWSNDATYNTNAANKTAIGTYAEGHQAGWFQNGVITASIGSYIWSRNGFIKNGSSNSYMLLGGGGHKALSDFATSEHNHNSSYISAVSISGNYLRVTKNGSNSDLTIPYAINAINIIGGPVKTLDCPSLSTLKTSYGLRSDYESAGHPTEEYLKAWCKYAYDNCSGKVAIGYVNPNSRGFIFADIYASGINSTSGLPEHITGRYYSHGGGGVKFGTSYGTWYYDNIDTNTTYSAGTGISLSGTTFSNSGVRSTTINGNYLRVNTNGTNADLTIPYATNAGNATNASNLISNTRMDYGWHGVNYFNLSAANLSAAKVNDTPYSSATWTHILRFNHANNAGYYTDLAIPFNNNGIYYKRVASGTLQNSNTNGGWISVLDNLNSSVSKSGETLTVKINGTAQSLTNTWRGILNNLTSDSTTDSLSAAQGKALNDKFGSYLPLSGGTMTGSITMGTNSIVFNQATTSNWNVAVNTGIMLLNTVGTSATGAPGAYNVGLSVSGYYGFLLATSGGGGRLLFRNTKRATYSSWSEIATIEDIPSTMPFSSITDGTSTSTSSNWSRILSNTYGGSLKSSLFMCHGGGYGMHLRGYSTSASVYMLQIYNSSEQVFAVWGDGHSNFGGNVNVTGNISATGAITGSSVTVNNGWLYMYRPVTTAEDTGVVTADNRIYWKYGNNSNVYMRYVTTYNPTTEAIGSTFYFPGYGTLSYTSVPIGSQGGQTLTIGSSAKRGNAANALYGMLRLYSLQASGNTGSVYYGQILTALLTANRTYYLPDDAGTIALTSDIPGNFVKSGSTAAAGLVPSPGTTAGTTKFLREDATWQVPTNTTYKLTINGTTHGDSTNGTNLGTINVFKASGTNHAIGLVPDPGATAGTTKFLREDGSWLVPAYPTNTWRKVLVAGTERLGNANNTGDLKFVSGTYTTVTWNDTNKTIQYDCNLIRYKTASNLTNLDVTKSFIYVTLSANVAASAFTLSAAMTVGLCLTVLVYNSGSSTISITVPSSWKSLDGYTLICGATKFIEISIVKYASGANDYILSSKAQ